MPLGLCFNFSSPLFKLLFELFYDLIQVLDTFLQAISARATLIELLVDFTLLSVHFRQLLLLWVSISLNLLLEFLEFSAQSVSLSGKFKYIALLLILQLGGLVKLLEHGLEFDRYTFLLLVLV